MPRGIKRPASDIDRMAEMQRAGRTYAQIGAAFGVSPRQISYHLSERRAQLSGIQAYVPAVHHRLAQHSDKTDLTVDTGAVLIGSDAHYWPGPPSTAHRAFVHLTKQLKPKVVILNGDVFDGASISRHNPMGWETRPTVIQEIEAVKERVGEITAACEAGTQRIWTLGNHDARFEARLAVVAPEFAKTHGFHLKDHFPDWLPTMAVWINDEVVVKHRWKGGIHAAHNNALWSGKTMVTGHLHSLKVTPFSDYNGDRWGVDCGTLADCYGPQFSGYTELAPVNWRSGFVVLTFANGTLLQPEMVRVVSEGKVDFRGEVLDV